MEREHNSQLELFSQDAESGKITSRTTDYSFLKRIWAYERSILVIIAIVITGIISFSLGVEKGKRLAAVRNTARFDVALKTQNPKPQPVLKQIIRQERYDNLPIKANQDTGSENLLASGYTIQLASYKTKGYAQKEADQLKRSGLSPIILSKGNYTILCVGNFPTQEKAQSLLSELSKRYKGCYTRRL